MKRRFPVNLHRGLNTNTSPKRIEDGECQIAQDVDYDTDGSVFSRKFKTTYLSYDHPPIHIYPYADLIVQLNNGTLYDGNTLLGSANGATPFNSLEYDDIWYGMNGTKQLRYNGTTLDVMGMDEPDTAATLADGGAGDLDGSYYYKYTYIDDNGKESNYSPVSAVIAVEDKEIDVTVVGSGSSKANYIALYRIGGTLTDYYLVSATITDENGTYEDSSADGDLVTLADAGNNDEPPSLVYFTEHYQRGVGVRDGTYPNSIWWSKEYQMEYWGNSTDYQYLLGGDDPCTGVLAWGQNVIVFKQGEIYVMEGVNPLKWHRRRANVRVGNIAPYSIDFWKLPIFCSYLGLYSFNSYTVKEISRKIRPWFADTQRQGELTGAVGQVFDGEYYFGLDSDTLVYDNEKDIFYTYNFGLGALHYDKNNGILYGGVGNNVVKLQQTDNDSSETVNFQVKSKAYPLAEIESQLGDLQNYIIQLDTRGNDVSFKVYIDEVLKQTITLNTDNLTRVRGNFTGSLCGSYVEFELVYSGTDRIQIDLPLIINPEKSE